MTEPFRNRSIFFQLFAGAMTILVFFALSWAAVYAHFLHELDRTNARRWAAASIVLHLQQARQNEVEEDFTSQEAFRKEFYETGKSPMVEQHRTAVTQLNQAIDTLTPLLDEDQRSIESHLQTTVQTYETAAERLITVYQQKGNGDYGVEGQWRAVVDTIQDRTHTAGEAIAIYADHLIGAQRNFLLDHDAKSIAAVNAATAGLARTGGSVKGLLDLAVRSDTLFHAYLTLQTHIEGGANDGLQTQLQRAAQDVETQVDTLLAEAIQDNNIARHRLTLVMTLVFLLELGFAALFFSLFGKGISRTTRKLGDAATAIGRGQFTARVDIASDNELGRLGAAFNRMAENLTALITSVQQSGVQINTSATEVATAALEQQATANEIAVTTNEVSATAKAISTTANELAVTMKDVTTVAERTAELASVGQTDITRMEATMRQITEASGSINTRLAVLSERASNITTVVTTIAKVADQTNLLSLNAAIEAEKAGEYGRGFSVVAAEIRRLADQTAVATGDIEQIVKEMQTAVTAGVMGMDKFSDEVRRGVEASGQVSEQLTEIIRQVQTLIPSFETVNDGMQTQAEGAQHISEALAQLRSAAQQTVESLVQSNQAVGQLNSATRELQAGVDRFTVQA